MPSIVDALAAPSCRADVVRRSRRRAGARPRGASPASASVVAARAAAVADVDRASRRRGHRRSAATWRRPWASGGRRRRRALGSWAWPPASAAAARAHGRRSKAVPSTSRRNSRPGAGGTMSCRTRSWGSRQVRCPLDAADPVVWIQLVGAAEAFPVHAIIPETARSLRNRCRAPIRAVFRARHALARSRPIILAPV